MHAVTAGARHHMNMQMRDAFVDRVVDADKATVGAEGGAVFPRGSELAVAGSG